jgi:hypothetical protein
MQESCVSLHQGEEKKNQKHTTSTDSAVSTTHTTQPLTQEFSTLLKYLEIYFQFLHENHDVSVRE